MVFPSQEGRFFDYENFGMIDTIAPFIETQKIQVYCVDGIDHETWFSKAPYSERISRVYDYEKTIINDVVPYVLAEGHYGAGIMTHGCSFGAFHATNFCLGTLMFFDLGLALSGCYDIGFAANSFDDFDAFLLVPLAILRLFLQIFAINSRVICLFFAVAKAPGRSGMKRLKLWRQT